MAKEKLSRSRELASKVIYAALQILNERGGQAPGKEVILEVENRVNLDDWAKATYEKRVTYDGSRCFIFIALTVLKQDIS